jgi:signal transduction histidine kinase/CheY-like chemotaxis protein
MMDYPALISMSDYRNISVNEIMYLKVGLIKDYALTDLFHTLFPNHSNSIEYDSTLAALDALDRGEVDLVMNSNHELLIMTNYLERIGYKANYIFDYSFKSTFGFNRDEAVLCSIINKAMSLIDTERISNQWMRKIYDYRVKVAEARLPWFIGAVILAFCVVALIFILFQRGRQHSRNLEQQLQRNIESAREAQAAHQAKNYFLAAMSHEMRTPMNVIIGMTSIGKNAIDTERKNYAFNKIGEAAVHLLSVIDDVLDISKINANKMEVSPVEFNFEGMIQKIVNIINFRIDESHHLFKLNVDQNIPRFIVGDDYHLSQVIMKLLLNAVKFTPENGEIGLDVSLATEKDGICEIRIEVSDNGIGISPEQQEKLFQSFEQVDGGLNREYGGTGLGLSISKHIVELMGGTIWVESDPDRGSRFIFTVKVGRGKGDIDSVLASVDKSELGRDGKFANKKLLIVEDVEINREILLSLLEDTEINIDCAENGQEAVDMITASPGKYNMVLMDVQMPKMDGLEATQMIRAKGFHNIPIIAMTAHIFKSDVEDCLSAGMDDHIGKPINIDEVLKKLHKYLYS